MWVLALIDSNWFAKGLQIYRKDETGLNDNYAQHKYHYGDHLVFLQPLYETPLDDLDLKWVELKQKRTPTLWEKFKKKVFGINYEEYEYNRPHSEEIVVVDYGDFYEIAEFSKCGDNYHWTTELNSYMVPVRWARLPLHILEMAYNKKQLT